MKKRSLLAGALSLTLLLLAGCGASASSSSSVPASSTPASSSEVASKDSSSQSTVPLPEGVYRGRVESVTDTDFTVAQMPGFDYGMERIVFHRDDNTIITTEGMEITEDAFVEVFYNGILTRSLPPQGTAGEVGVIATFSEGIIVNGTITAFETTTDGYTITILPFEGDTPSAIEEAASASFENMVILNVPKDALENITEDELKEGTAVSAVTKGIAAMSLPPQMPVHTLLPFTVPVLEEPAPSEA